MSAKETAPWFRFFNAMNRAGKALTPTERTVLGCLFTYADGPDKSTRLDNSRPGLDALVADTGMSRSTVQRTLTQLEDKGWIVVTSQGGRKGSRGWATCYRLVVPTQPAIKGVTGDTVSTSSLPVDNSVKGVTGDTVSDAQKVSPVEERVSPATGKGVTHDTPPPQYLLNTSGKASPSITSPEPVDKFADADTTTSATATPATGNDRDGLLAEEIAEEKRGDDDLPVDALEVLDRLEPTAHTPEPPADLQDAWDAVPPAAEPPTGDDEPAQVEIGPDPGAVQDHPAAALARYRAAGHPARVQESAATIATRFRMPA